MNELIGSERWFVNSVKRDLLQKRPITVSRETYYSELICLERWFVNINMYVATLTVTLINTVVIINLCTLK